MTILQRTVKRSFDLFFSAMGLACFWWLIFISWLLATLDTGINGFFTQERIGRNGEIFKVIKIRTMRVLPQHATFVTTSQDPRITRLGSFFRKTKIDELPQLINVLLGQMSFVGPRPDVPGFADELRGQDSMVLSIRPGITGPATIKYRNEEDLLARQPDPEYYNRVVIFPDKVRINREYLENYSFIGDIRYIVQTVLGKCS